jgi:hypothetical protein
MSVYCSSPSMPVIENLRADHEAPLEPAAARERAHAS